MLGFVRPTDNETEETVERLRPGADIGVVEAFSWTVLFVGSIGAVYGGGTLVLATLHLEHVGQSLVFVAVAQLLGTGLFLAVASRVAQRANVFPGMGPAPKPTVYAALVGLGASLQFVLAAGAGALERWFPVLRRSLQERERMEAAMSIDGLPSALAVVLGVVVVAPLTEEWVFRGWLLPSLARKRGAAVSVVVTAFCFGLVHLDPSAVIYASFAGLVLGWLRLVTGSLRASLVVHAVSNAVPVLLSPKLCLIPGFNDGAASTALLPFGLVAASLTTFVVSVYAVWRLSVFDSD